MKIPLMLLIVAAAAPNQSCQKQIPIWNRDIYVGNSLSFGIERKQGEQFISCQDPRFGKYICVKEEDYLCYVETYIINSKGWKKQSQCGLQPSKP